MPLSCLPRLFLLLSFVGGCFCKKVYVIGLMAEVRTAPKCQKIDAGRVKVLEAAYWLIDRLNNNSMQDTSFEIKTLDVCKNLSAVPAMMVLINEHRKGPKKLIGILTALTSKKAIMLSQTIMSLPEEYRIIQMGLVETAMELNNRNKYENLFRILPDDRTQMQMICDVLVQIKWNYIALLYQDDVYGRQGAQLFSKCAKEVNIHIRATLEINISNLEVLKFDFKQISGAVIIAQTATVEKFLEIDRFGRKMSFIISETTKMHTNLFKIHRNGALLVIQRAFFKNQKFEQHWEDLFKQAPRNTTSKNRFFQTMIEEVSQCSFMDANNSCDMENALQIVTSEMPEFDSTEPIATGLYAITSALGRIPETSCSSGPNCQSFYKEALEAFHKPINYVFLKDEMGYQRMNIETAFNANGTLTHPPNWVLYQLYCRKKYKLSGPFSAMRVGSYSSSGLILSTHIIPGYDAFNKEFPVQSVTCEPGFNCKGHQETPGYIYKEGDIMFVGIVPIHKRETSDPSSCGDMRLVSGVSIAEAMLFAIKELNDRQTYKNIFPGKKIGILILDTCSSDIIILKKLFALRNDDSAICGKHLNCAAIRDKTIVYIGPLFSQTSRVVSKIMTSQHTVQISYASTSNTLSDREVHPHFMRTCTSDGEQLKVIINLLVRFSWKYISIIYKDDLYGISFKDSFIDKSKQHGICVIRAIPYSETVDSQNIINKLRQRPEAKVILLFVGSNQVSTFLQNFLEIMFEKEFVFLGSEAWADKIQLHEMASKIEGSLTLGLAIEENEDFRKYSKERILNETGMDEWLENYLELTCYLPLSLNKMSKISCTPNYTLFEAEMKSVWIPFVIDAINAAAIGLYKSISEICPDGIVCEKLFESTDKLIQNIKNVQLKKSGGNYRIFNDNGDGRANYNIYNIRHDGRYVKVAQWSSSNGIVPNQDFQPPLGAINCPNEKHCSECIYGNQEVRIHKEEEEKSYTIPLVVSILLLLLLFTIICIFVWKRKPTPTAIRCQPDGGGHSRYVSDRHPDETALKTMEPNDQHTTPKELED